MSFILDALRKSESERQRASVPGIAHVPVAASRPTLPAWAIAVMVLLGGSVILMTGAWWFALESGADRSAAAGIAERSAAAMQDAGTLPPAPTVEPARTTAPPDAASLRAAASAPPREAPSPLQRLAADGAPPRETAPYPADGFATAAPELPAAALPSAADLRARGEDLPALRLELHVFAAAAADRYVFINGKMYREGQTLPEGPLLLRIDPTGAVLRHGGREFLLTQ